VITEVDGEVRFANRQKFSITAATYHQQIAQSTAISTRTTTQQLGRRSESRTEFDWPLSVDFSFTSNADGTGAQTTSIDQRYERSSTALTNGLLTDFHVESNHVAPSDTLLFDATGAVTGSTGQVSSQHFFTADERGGCFSRDLTAAAGVLTAVVDGRECGR
jgi:hypothetical protein